jgi:alkylation response protein AidB-like acyl-CoA dehydrogenase
MRDIVSARHLRYAVLETDPAALLRATRHFVSENGSLGTRCTVQYNLFAGSIVFLGGDAHRRALYASQSRGALGCFAFTEQGAGVLTGKGVETEARYDANSKSFTLNSPTDTATKYWISQGLFAEYAVILAELIVNGTEKKGPHLFYTRIQRVAPGGASRGRGKGKAAARALVPMQGVDISSLSPKTAFSGLDNAFIRFDNFVIPKSSLLDKFCSLDDSGRYEARLPDGAKRMLDVLLTRLLTGRVCLSEYAVHHSLGLMRRSYAYAATRMLWMGIREQRRREERGEALSSEESQQYMMSNRPLIHAALVDYSRSLAVVADYIALTREGVARSILRGVVPRALVEAVCICKFTGTSLGVDATSALRKVMGARALLEEAHLGSSSFVGNLTCAAEGDDTIMEMKVVGDLVTGGLSSLFPLGLMWRTAFGRDPGWMRKRLLWVYIKNIISILLVGKRRALDEGQLIKDIAWARAHLVIVDKFLSAKKSDFSNGEISSGVVFAPSQPGDGSRGGTAGGSGSGVGSGGGSGGGRDILCGQWACLTAADASSPGAVDEWMHSYERIMIRFPTPTQL